MRIALLVLASGFALSISAPTFAEETVPDATRFATPQPIAARQVNTDKQCHHLIHEGAMTVEHCVSPQSWETTRLATQQAIIDFQHHSYVTPTGR